MFVLKLGVEMLKFALTVVILLTGAPLFAQSHSSINGLRSSYNKNIFFQQSIMGYYGRTSKKGNPDLYGAKNQSWTGFGLKDGFGFEISKFIQVSAVHTMIDQEAKSSSLEHFKGNELNTNLTLVFSSPMGNLGFGTGLFASQVSMQNIEKSSRFTGTGREDHIKWNYFLSSSFSITASVERAYGIYQQSGGDTGIEKFTMKRDGIGLGFMIWL